MGLPSPSISSSFVSAEHNVWRGDELGMADRPVVGTGHAALDAELPGGGWPVGALTELLQTRPEVHVWQLLLPALAQAVKARGGRVVLIGAPHEPFGPTLAASGLPAEALLWIRCEAASVAGPAQGARGLMGGQQKNAVPSLGAQHSSRIWACEQALRCADIAAVLAWLPQAQASQLRRLQLAAAQHEALLFVMRPEVWAESASPARLRLQIVSAAAGQMDLRLLKRRGPPLARALTLPARSEPMTALLVASQLRRQRHPHPQPRREGGQGVGSVGSVGKSMAFKGATVVRLDLRKSPEEATHAVDRLALAD